VTSKAGACHASVLNIQQYLFGQPFALERKALETNAEIAAITPLHSRFEAAETVNIQHDRRVGLKSLLTANAGAVYRKIFYTAFDFGFIGGHKDGGFKIRSNAIRCALLCASNGLMAGL